MNSQKEKKKGFHHYCKDPKQGGFLIPNCRVGIEDGCWGNREGRPGLVTQTLDCETSGDSPPEQQPLFLSSSPKAPGSSVSAASGLWPVCTCCLLTFLGEWGCVCLDSRPTPTQSCPGTNGFV